MAEIILPELFIGEAFAAEAAFGGFGAEAAFGGFGAEAAFGAGEALGGFGLGEAGIGEAIGGFGLEAGAGGLEALGGFGFEAPAGAEAFGFEGGLSGAEGLTGAEATTQGGFTSAGLSENIGADAIGALNEPSLADPGAFHAGETTELGSVAGDAAGDALGSGFSDQSTLSAVEPSAEEFGAFSESPGTGGTSQGPTEAFGNQEVASTNPTGDPATEAAGGQAGRGTGLGRAGAAPAAAAGAGGMNPMQALSQLGKLLGGKPDAPSLGRGTGYAGALGDFGQKQIGQYNSGALRPEDLATLMTQQKAALNKMRQFYAQSGNYNSTARRQAENQIMQQSVAQQVQFFNQYLTSGMQALGQASNSMLQAARIEIEQNKAYQSSLNSALSGMSSLFGSGGKGGSNNSSGNNVNNSYPDGSTGGGYDPGYGGGDYDYATDYSIG